MKSKSYKKSKPTCKKFRLPKTITRAEVTWAGIGSGLICLYFSIYSKTSCSKGAALQITARAKELLPE